MFFLVASYKIYQTEMERQDAITEKILREAIVTTKLDGGTSNDGVITHHFGIISCLLLIRETKNEGGSSSGDPSVEVGFSYIHKVVVGMYSGEHVWYCRMYTTRTYIIQGTYFRDRTSCPSFLHRGSLGLRVRLRQFNH